MRKWLPALAVSAAAAFVSSVLTAPQALAQDSKPVPEKVPGTNVEFSPSAARDPRAHALAAANPAAVQAGGLLCGSGYRLSFVDPLPDSRRFGTLFTYFKESMTPAMSGACALFDNNLGVKKHMKLKLCWTTCKVDEGSFFDYAGPVKYESNDPDFQPRCAEVNALMWEGDIAIIDRQTDVAACD
ncbi:hypothetical protein AV521_44020 [Streptomyces sp. IMTB 2501]|uniref:hypothetical protein n=1 Tax=Streptomyces sp. IMTB 2501 TaxID=1776340 RepID=UPI00096E5A58|nr:hypothetical protein [Streptomyces sp. IMTB 2501]OLZ61189.1 hypothetical protein AV521_44020 [Streptomyces sp. IMTB 2501]